MGLDRVGAERASGNRLRGTPRSGESSPIPHAWEISPGRNIRRGMIDNIKYLLNSCLQEERSIFWEVMRSIILSKNVHIKEYPISNGFRYRTVWKLLIKKKYYVLFLIYYLSDTFLQFIINSQKFDCQHQCIYQLRMSEWDTRSCEHFCLKYHYFPKYWPFLLGPPCICNSRINQKVRFYYDSYIYHLCT